MKFPPVVILVGSMGAGKTSTGKDLAKALGFDFFDTDHWIEERNKKTIPKIFKDSGEAFFRSEEKEAIRWIQDNQRLVVSTGGGLWIDDSNREQLLSLGWCVWLEVSTEEAWKRVGPHLGQRPMLETEKDPKAVLNGLLIERNPVYQKAHKSFSTDGKTAEAVAAEIFDVLKKDNVMDLA